MSNQVKELDEKPIPSNDRLLGAKLSMPHELNPKIDSALSSLILLTMELKASDRIKNVGDFREAFIQKQNKPINNCN